MRFLIFLRDRVLPYLFLLIIVVGGLGSIGWLLARTYFWQTSDVTFLTDGAVSAEIDISARIIYYDIPLFEATYPFHIVLPYHQTVNCNQECHFADIPAGDTTILFRTANGEQFQEKIVILPDTIGTIDLRMPIKVRTVSRDEIGKSIASSPDESVMKESIFYADTLQGLWLWYKNSNLFLYDAEVRQNILLANLWRIRMAVRGINEGEYYLINEKNEVLLFDRYGRKKTELVTQISFQDKQIIWEQRWDDITSKVIIDGQERVFFGRLFWAKFGEKIYLSNGDKVFDIIK